MKSTLPGCCIRARLARSAVIGRRLAHIGSVKLSGRLSQCLTCEPDTLRSMTATAPWWGVPVLAGGFTLLGVALSQLFTFLLEKTRAKRSEAQRWDADLRQLYARYLVEARRLRDASVVRFDGDPEIPDTKPFLHTHEEVELIAPDEVFAVARRFKDAVMGIWSAAAGGKWADTALFVEYTSAWDAFSVAARKSFGRSVIRMGADNDHHTS